MAMHKDWGALTEFYFDLAKRGDKNSGVFTAIGSLCASVSNNELRDGLFGHTSMFDLRVSQVETDFPPHHAVQWLVIRPDTTNAGIDIGLESGQPHNEGNWGRKVSTEDLETCFNEALHQLGWSYYPPSRWHQ